MDAGKVVIGVVAGIATGALLGVLFAPDKGFKTRKRISRDTERITDDITVKFQEFVDSITDKFEKVKEDVTNFAEKAKATEKQVEKDLKTSKVQ
jgi:gas vesicle protein